MVWLQMTDDAVEFGDLLQRQVPRGEYRVNSWKLLKRSEINVLKAFVEKCGGEYEGTWKGLAERLGRHVSTVRLAVPGLIDVGLLRDPGSPEGPP